MFPKSPSRFVLLAIGTIVAALFVLGTVVQSEQKLSDPIYRVAYETTATDGAAATGASTPASPAAAASTTVSAEQPAEASPFDLTTRPDDHPLAVVLRAVKDSQQTIDEKVRDYSCTFVKQECIEGELGETQHIFMKVMQQPFSVYMKFLQPFAGREVLYVAGQNEGKMVAREAGWKGLAGKMNLDPQGALAMKGQKRPITDVGIRNLTTKLVKMWEDETKFAECDVKTDPSTKVAGRPATMLQIMHPVPRQEFKFHIARLFLDNELKVPIHFDAFLWPEQEGADPPLEESYTYMNLKLNNNYTAREFDANNNPEIFK